MANANEGGIFTEIRYRSSCQVLMVATMTFLGVLPPLPARADLPLELEAGKRLAAKGHFVEAAEIWEVVGKDLLTETDVDRRFAGLAYILSTIAFELGNDERAYRTWAEATRIFLEAGSRWEDEARALRNRLDAIRYELRTVAADGGPPKLRAETRLLIELDDLLKVAAYVRPSTRLGTGASRKASDPIYVARGYIPRPLVVANADEQAPLVRSRQPLFAGPASEEPGANEAVADAAAAGAAPEVAHLFEPSPKKSSRDERVPPVIHRIDDGATLSPDQLEIARTAWLYFTANRQANTGMFHTVRDYPYATLWDLASGLAALVAAGELELIDRATQKVQLEVLLTTLAQIPLYSGELPNREYSSRTGEMIDSKNRPSAIGSGWAAVGLGRLLIWLRIIRDWYPELVNRVDAVVARWSFDRLQGAGEMMSTFHDGKREHIYQDGRFGYEQYAATGYLLWDVELPLAFDFEEVEPFELLGVDLVRDTRDRSFLGSAPFLLAAIELGGIDAAFEKIIKAVFQVQRRRFEEEEIITAVSEDAVNRPPWFVYNNIHFKGSHWTCVDSRSRPAEEFSSLSTKAAIGWWALYPSDPYARLLYDSVRELTHPRLGFFAGRFDDGSINNNLNGNTNAVILEALLYLHRGSKPFLTVDPETIPQSIRRGREGL